MDRIEFNVTTGELKVIPLTAEEIADAQKRTEVEAAQRAKEVMAAENHAKRQAAIDALLAEQAQRADAPKAVKDYAAVSK